MIAIAIMPVGIVARLIDARPVRESRKVVTVGGKGSMDRKNPLGAFPLPATGFAALGLVIIAGVLLPFFPGILGSACSSVSPSPAPMP